jgi:hypothetical protein
MRSISPFMACVAMVALTAAAARGQVVRAETAVPSVADAEFFEKDIRPLLIDRCHKCHGDAPQPKGKLRLTSRQAVLDGGESGPAAVPGDASKSLLIAAVKHDGLEMPPEEEPLPPLAVAKLESWVQRGLPWPATDPQVLERARHAAVAEQIAQARRRLWSLQPVRCPPVPTVRDENWPRTPVDRFVLAELEKRSLAPSPLADRRTLLRRVTFDLVGLPPAPDEIADFINDTSHDAFAKVVDRLLASPRYGERWGRYWLDVARYADTKGYVLFQDANFPWSYTYRDYLVRALNDDLPYDRFIVEQLAADLLPLGADRRPLTALGFLTLGNGFMNNQHDVVDDRIDVVTRGLLGLTVSCARCHDHKFDPIPTEDYYSLYGVLASAVEPTVPPLFEDPPDTEAYRAFAGELAERERKLHEFIDQKYRELIQSARTRAGEYLLAAQALQDKPATEEFMLLADGNDLNPTMINRYRVFLARSSTAHDPVLALWHALAGLPDKEFPMRARVVVEQAIARQTADTPINPLVAGAFLGKPLASMADVGKSYGELLAGIDSLWRSQVEAAASASQPPPLALADPNAEVIRQLLYGPESPASIEQNQLSELALLPDRPAQDIRNKLLKAVEEWRASGPAAPPRAMALEDLKTPIKPRIFRRGNPSDLGAEVPRQFLSVLCEGAPTPFTQGSGRLELARAIADRANPLTARVLVNRVWQMHFGSGLVGTPSDFGTRSQSPTHPELLDYLASSFMERGWSLKALHREIVLSAVYQQASDSRADARAIDPENLLLWKMNRRRLDFEATRDALLAVAGRLETTLGGPPIKGIAEPAATRRAIYSYIDRLNLPGVFRTFDFPSPDATSPERAVTTVPQQALFFLNSPLVVSAAKGLLARDDVAAQTDPAGKIARLYLTTFGRPCAPDELDWALAFLSGERAREDAWNELAQALLLANEFVFID